MHARILLTAVLCLCAIMGMGEVRTIKLNENDLFYHFVAAKGSKAGLVIFLHGSVKAFEGQRESKPVPAETLLEGNAVLLETFTEHGYDVVLPICYNRYNWLDTPGATIIDTLLRRYGGRYSHIYIAGFSDGGTGAYRYFYTHPERYSGLIVLNGYPQLANFYRKVDYRKCTDKLVIFMSQEGDKVVPYEFLLTEYRRQKMVNRTTYFRLRPGKHELRRYGREDIESVISLLSNNSRHLSAEVDSIWVYPPLDAYMWDERLLELYPFRSRVAKSYGMSEREYRSAPELEFNPGKDELRVFPLKVARTSLDAPAFDFPMEKNGQRTVLRLPNYGSWPAW